MPKDTNPKLIPRTNFTTLKEIKNGKNTAGENKPYTPRLTPTQLKTIQALREQGLAIYKIAKTMHLNPATISRALTVKDPMLSDGKFIASLRDRSNPEFRLLGHRAYEHITDKKLENSSASQLVMIKAISEDKARLIDGKVTARIGFEDLTDRELESKLKTDQDLLEKLERGEIIDVTEETIESEVD